MNRRLVLATLSTGLLLACSQDADEGSVSGSGNPLVLDGGLEVDTSVCPPEANLIVGTEGDDELVGTAGDDCIIGLGGNDWIAAGGGDDTVVAGAGNDTVIGGRGRDNIDGQEGDDVLAGDDGRDLGLDAGNMGGDPMPDGGADDADAGAEAEDGNRDVLIGGAGNDTLAGEQGDDELSGGSGDDELRGGVGNDVLTGSEGNDVLSGDQGQDELRGGPGEDELQGGNGDDSCWGDEGDDTLIGGHGDDTLEGGADNDRVLGELGDDQLTGGNCHDALLGGQGLDSHDGGEDLDACEDGACELADDVVDECAQDADCEDGERCVANVGFCVALAPDATCDGVDDDCDGQQDEDYVAPITTCGVGACASEGVIACVGGVLGDTCVPGLPVEEICGNAIDEDCDGEDCPATLPPDLWEIGPQTVAVGSTLSLQLVATDPNGDEVSFGATPLPLPENSSLDGATGLFEFSPVLDQVGEVVITFSASDGSLVSEETVVITVTGPAPGAPTALSGRVLDTQDFVDTGLETAVVGAVISLLGTGVTSVTDQDGFFTLSGLPSGSHILDINTTSTAPAPDGSAYAGFREEIVLIEGVDNVVGRPFYLPRIDASSLTTVDPSTVTMVHNPNLDITVEVPAGSAQAEGGGLFTGELSISEVPEGLAPAALPPELDPGLLITIQPVGVTFDTPAPISMPNIDGLAPGSEVDLWSLDPDTGTFVVVGTGVVSADGSTIDTVDGGIIAADWHAFLPPAPSAGNNQNNGSNQNPGNCPQCPAGSRVLPETGELLIEHALVPYRSLDRARESALVYKSEAAAPGPVLRAAPTILRRAAVPLTMSTTLTVGGVDQGMEIFTDTSSLSESVDETLFQAMQFDAKNLVTGRYRYSFGLTSHYSQSSVGSAISGRVMVHNLRDSPFGAGWNLNLLNQLVRQDDGSVLVVEGDGAMVSYQPAPIDLNTWSQAGPTGNGNWNVSDDGGSVLQTVNGQPTFFISPTDFIDVTINGTLRVETTSDDDFIGFVFGYREPLGTGTTGDFLLFDWKQGQQSGAAPGFTLTRVDGTVGSSGWWPHTSSAMEVLSSDVGAGKGWQDHTTHDFELIYRSDYIRVRIDGLTVAEVDGVFEPGRFGFYNYSQAQVRYTSFTSSSFFESPEGDFATLVRNADGGFTRRHPNGLQDHFDPDGRHTSTEDRNGNVTSFEYDADGRLIRITDPAAQVTELVYTASGIELTDPVGRTTELLIDDAGNLVGIIDPDATERTFGYDGDHRLISQTDKRGFVTSYVYDAFGRFQSSTLPDGAVRSTLPADVLALAETASGEGSAENPAEVVRPGVIASTHVDAEGRGVVMETDLLGGLLSLTDPIGLSTTVERDADGNETRTVFASGQAYASTYDERGNMLTRTDEVLGGVATYTYEATHNKVTSIQDSTGNAITLEYNGEGDLLRLELPSGRALAMTYFEDGRLASETDFIGITTSYTYDDLGNLSELRSSAGGLERVVSMDNSSSGAVTSFTDAEGQTTTFAYDGLDRLVLVTDPAGLELATQYDAQGNRVEVTPPGMPAHTFTYDSRDRETSYSAPLVSTEPTVQSTSHDLEGQPTERVHADGRRIEVTYDAAGRIGSATTSQGSYAFEYDPSTGQRTQISAPDLSTVTFEYAGDRIASISWAGTATGRVGLGYDADGQLVSHDVEGTLVNYAYDVDGQLVGAGDLSVTRDAATGLVSGTSLNLATSALTYNGFGELQQSETLFDGAPLHTMSYTRDLLGRVIEQTEAYAGTTTVTSYAYDAAGRLVEVSRNGLLDAIYTYDDNGNRTGVDGPGGVVSATYDFQDRLLSYGSLTYEYLESGELLSKTDGATGDVTMYEYDELGNLRSVALPSSELIEYEIDGQSRRVGRLVDGVVTQRWLYKDDLEPIAELDESGNVRTVFVYADDPHTPAYMLKEGVPYRIVSDGTGSVRLVVNATDGSVAQRLDYDAFGAVVVDTEPGFQPFGFAGGIYDAATGLVRFGARDYDPSTGRWTAKDPIGFDGDQPNLYTYLGGDPVNDSDPAGLNPGLLCLTPPGAPVCTAAATKTLALVTTAAAACAGLIYMSKARDEREGDGTRGKSIDEIVEKFKDKLSPGELKKLIEKVQKIRGKRNKQKRKK